MKFTKALVVAVSLLCTSAMAADQLIVNPKTTIVPVTVTPAICNEVGNFGEIIKKYVEKDYTDQEIIDRMYEAGRANLHDTDGWAAVNMMAKVEFISHLRTWSVSPEYQILRKSNPEATTYDLHGAFAEAACNQLLGTPVGVQQVIRVTKGIRM